MRTLNWQSWTPQLPKLPRPTLKDHFPEAEIQEKYTTKDSQFVEIDGLKIHYRDQGSGPVLVLVHGLISSLHIWNKWTELLKSDFRVIRLDLPGFGLSDAPETVGQDLIDNYVKTIKGLLDHLGIDKCHIGGSSMGGWVAWEMTYQHPELIDKMVLVCPAGYQTKEQQPNGFKYMKPFFTRYLELLTFPLFLTRYMVMHRAFSQRIFIKQDMLLRRYDLINRKSNRMFLAKLCGLELYPKLERIKQIKHNSLIMWGDKDEVIESKHAYQFRCDLENSNLVMFEGQGHAPCQEVVHQTVFHTKRFLNDEMTDRERFTYERVVFV